MEPCYLIPRQWGKSTYPTEKVYQQLHMAMEQNLEKDMDPMYVKDIPKFRQDNIFDTELPFRPDSMFGEETLIRTYELDGSPLKTIMDQWIRSLQDINAPLPLKCNNAVNTGKPIPYPDLNIDAEFLKYFEH